jgi:hypothetical protein
VSFCLPPLLFPRPIWFTFGPPVSDSIRTQTSNAWRRNHGSNRTLWARRAEKWDTWPESVKQQWDAAMNLGDAGRKAIKGHDRDYYLNILRETRAKSLAEFSKRDDAWLMAVDKDWPWGPTNNFCKWFHVCEHEAHHSGQIAFLRKRLPGAKPETE